MKRSPIAVLALLLAVPGALPASAHRPYFTQSEPVLLPDDQPGEMRLLRGDGIVFADPYRIVVLDRDSRLLALSRESVPISLICRPGQASCWGYDHDTGRVLVLDPDTFGIGGPIVPGRDQRDGLYEIAGDYDSWGFAGRDASLAERLEAEWALARRMPRTMAILVALGAAVAAIGLLGLHRPGSREARGLWLWAIGILARCAGMAVAIMPAMYIGALMGPSLTGWRSGLGIGAMLFLLAWALARWRKPATRPA